MRLVAEGLSCVRGATRLFAELSFTVESGQALIVTGANGSGKSSLLRILAGLASPAAGTIVLEGGNPEAGLGEQTHYLGHLDGVKGVLSVEENLGFWRALLGAPAATVDVAMREVGLSTLARLPAMLLSAGQKRRLALARLRVSHRPLWLLDEPTTALDRQAQATFTGLCRRHLDEGGLLVAATHAPLDLGSAQELILGRRAVP